MLNKFIGKWRLIPSKSIYPLGNPPLSCLYSMKYNNENNLNETRIKWEMKYETFDNKIGEVNYEMNINGIYEPFSSPMVDEIMSELSIQENLPSLDSYSKKDGVIVQISHRILLSDQELKIIQTFPQNNLSNIQFYEKCDE